MKRLLLLMLFPLFLWSGEAANALLHEDSPYLQQHAYNPVKWLPWGDEAFEKARSENKPLFLSIGYSTCHWCHVMARESFESEAVAELINRHTVPVKVDREELPHLDSYYQRLYMKVKGRSGGWPLSIFMTDGRKPFFVATYIPPTDNYGIEGMQKLLPKLHREYREERELVERRGNVMLGMMQRRKGATVEALSGTLNETTLWSSYKEMYDPLFFGFSRAPKYPEASKIALLLDLGKAGNEEAEAMALEVLRTMALRGLYDHIDGGFFRYAVDAAWEIPHFEKMLYNQAELVPLYTRAYRLSGEAFYRDIAEETIAMVYERFEKEGLFFSASDADTDHHEGGYFIYSVEEVNEAIAAGADAKALEEAFEVLEGGNFEGKVHLNIYTDERPAGFEAFRKRLKALRRGREYPFIDRKVITAWNAMMIEALYRASEFDERYLERAESSLQALLSSMYREERLYHQTLFGKEAVQEALMEDYAFLVSALLAGYEATYDASKLALAADLTEQAIARFYDKGMWFQNDEGLKVGADLRDKYYTSSFGRMVQNLWKLAALQEEFRYARIAKEALKTMRMEIVSEQADAPSSAIAAMMQRYGVVVLKHDRASLLRHRNEIRALQHPFVWSKTADTKGLFQGCDIGSCFVYSKVAREVFDVIESRTRALP